MCSHIKVNIITIIVQLFVCCCYTMSDDAIIVQTRNGLVKGFSDTNYKNEVFYSFLGIPFAKPVTGNRRFRAPEAADGWEGVLDATRQGDCCLQPPNGNIPQKCSEDCLNLNVFTKLNSPQSKRLNSVMVWIHGGAFLTGSNTPGVYGAKFLLTEDIVLVSINYRLGLLGFAQFEDSSLGVTGNAGLKDQIEALKWVKNNIEFFGGNPNDVTVAGGSAGGASTHALMLSPMAKGLFHKAIVQDGCAINMWVGALSTSATFNKYNEDYENDTSILERLEAMTSDDLILLQMQISLEQFSTIKRALYGLVVENSDVSLRERVFPKKLIDAMNDGDFNDVPILIGHNINEGVVLNLIMNSTKEKWGKIEQLPDIEDYVPFNLGYAYGTEMRKSVAQKIINHYYKTGNTPNFNLMSDLFFKHGMHVTVKKHRKKSNFPIYYYLFSADTDLNFLKNLLDVLNDIPGSVHYDEAGYLFNSIATPDIEPESEEEITMLKTVKLWTNFVKTGNPTPDFDDSLLNIIWKPVQDDKMYMLNITASLEMIEEPGQEDFDFWDDLFQSSPEGAQFVD